MRAIADKLKRHGLKPWLDEEQILPGRLFRDVIQEAIQNVKSAAIFIGPQGLGKWQIMELRSLMSKLVEVEEIIWSFIELERPVISVFLQSTLQEPKLPIYPFLSIARDVQSKGLATGS